MANYEYRDSIVSACPAFPEECRTPRPFVVATLRNGKRKTPLFAALVDTGADQCCFPTECLADLGLVWDDMPSATLAVAGGDGDVRFATVSLWVDGIGELEVYAGFSNHLGDGDYGILGYHGFLERMRSTFDPRAGMFSLDPTEYH
jgi:hypothetical protein